MSTSATFAIPSTATQEQVLYQIPGYMVNTSANKCKKFIEQCIKRSLGKRTQCNSLREANQGVFQMLEALFCSSRHAFQQGFLSDDYTSTIYDIMVARCNDERVTNKYKELYQLIVVTDDGTHTPVSYVRTLLKNRYIPALPVEFHSELVSPSEEIASSEEVPSDPYAQPEESVMTKPVEAAVDQAAPEQQVEQQEPPRRSTRERRAPARYGQN